MKLESETDISGILYPNVEAHKQKDGHEQMKSFDLSTISNENIEEAVNKGKQEAQKAMDELGMKEQLSDCWNNPTVSGDTSLNMNDYEDEEDKEEGVLLTDDMLEEVYDESHLSSIKSDVGKLKDAEIIDKNLSTEMLKKHSKLDKINSHNLPLCKSTLDDQKMILLLRLLSSRWNTMAKRFMFVNELLSGYSQKERGYQMTDCFG